MNTKFLFIAAGLGICITGYILLYLSTDWKITFAIFLIHWSINIHMKSNIEYVDHKVTRAIQKLYPHVFDCIEDNDKQ